MARPATYQLVLARQVSGKGAHGVGWRPETIYELHLPPNSVDYRPRPANVVTPLFGGAHIESAPTILCDLTISLENGIAMMLSTDGAGRPAILGGKDRDLALRRFLQTASETLATEGWRMEFHADSRGLHLQVVPTGQGHTFQTGTMSRNGGAGVQLSFTGVGALDGPVGLIGSINAAIRDVTALAGVVAGGISYGADRARQVLAIPGAVAGIVPDVLAQFVVAAAALQQVADGAAGLLAVPADTLRIAAARVDEISDAFVAADAIATAQIWHDLGVWADSALALVTQGSFAASALAQGAAGAAGTPQAAFAKFQSQQLALGNSNAANYTTPQFDEFDAVTGLAEYHGWVPYVVQQGDTVFDVAQATLGSVDKWPAIAWLNGLDAALTDLQVGTTIKIPVGYAAIPFAATPQYQSQAAMQQALTEFVYLRGFALAPVPDDIDGAVDFVIDPDDPRDVVTVTGIDNVVQRYRHLGFRTDLGSNPTFPDFGVWLGVGRPNSPALAALTRVSAQQLLNSDPRITAVALLRDEATTDTVDVEFGVTTANTTISLALPQG